MHLQVQGLILYSWPGLNFHINKNIAKNSEFTTFEKAKDIRKMFYALNI